MTRGRFATVGVGVALCAFAVRGQQPAAQQPSDLNVELRSATGSNRFQIGEVIRLEAVFSSSSPKKYLEPCILFWESNFGFPQCRFRNHWSFTIKPESGWADLTKLSPEGPPVRSGPMYEVASRDLSSDPMAFPYSLTHRFRFEVPGTYRVQLSVNVGLDDETTARGSPPDDSLKPHFVSLTPEIVLEIVPATPEWQSEVIRKGSEAYSHPSPRVTEPPSPELTQYRLATEALCNLGTAEAARALARLLAEDHREVKECLRATPSAQAAIEEMQRLLVDPAVGVHNDFFATLVLLLSRQETKQMWFFVPSPEKVDGERDLLFAALASKREEAQIPSLLTVLANPPRAAGSPTEFAYDLPFAQPVIESVVANFDRFPPQSKQWVLDQAWERVRSPLMLPVVRQNAKTGDGQALLRWLELDPTAATAFIRDELVAPAPRFSSFYLRLPDASLPEQEREIARNFAALRSEYELVRSASLLHRYATGAVLPIVLPFIREKRPSWSCSVQIPALAYLFKVAPAEGTAELEQSLATIHSGSCQSETLVIELGTLEPGPALERIAMKQVEGGDPEAAGNSARYLQLHGSAAAKPFVWQQLVRWHERFVSSGAEKRMSSRPFTLEDAMLNSVVSSLALAYAGAQGWVLSPEEANRLLGLLGKGAGSLVGCAGDCASTISVGPGAGEYMIRAIVNASWERRLAPLEFLNPTQRIRYSVGRFECADMRALKEKLLQFPPGSVFSFTYNFTPQYEDELLAIRDFLESHGFRIKNLKS